MAEKIKWVRVTRAERCQICAHGDFCTISVDGKVAHCMRIPSAKEAKGSLGGWIHDLADPVAPVAAPRAPKKQVADVTALAMKMFKDSLAIEKRQREAASLGVSPISLWSLRVGIGWDYDGREFSSWPARDASGGVIGITRRYGDGEKKTMAGTNNGGIFIPERWWMQGGPVMIVEGGSDTAALVTHGFAPLGRPSNVGGARIICAYLAKRARGRRCIVIGENDRKLERVGTVPQCQPGCPGCAWCWPGRYGAERVAGQLGCEWRMVPESHKDVRAWANAAGEEFRDTFRAWAKGPAPMEVIF